MRNLYGKSSFSFRPSTGLCQSLIEWIYKSYQRKYYSECSQVDCPKDFTIQLTDSKDYCRNTTKDDEKKRKQQNTFIICTLVIHHAYWNVCNRQIVCGGLRLFPLIKTFKVFSIMTTIILTTVSLSRMCYFNLEFFIELNISMLTKYFS